MHKPPTSQFRFIGTPLPRKEDARLTTGAGRFSDDFSVPGQCYLAVVRSPYPHARIRGIDFTAALAMPGVLAAYSGADCLADGLSRPHHRPPPTATARDGQALIHTVPARLCDPKTGYLVHFARVVGAPGLPGRPPKPAAHPP